MISYERQLLSELEFPSLHDSAAELKTIISEVNLENPSSSVLFKGRYQILLLENLLPWQKPIGKFFETVIAVCGVKLKKVSTTIDDSQYDNQSHLSDEEAEGTPLPVIFDSLISMDTASSTSVIRHLKEKYHLYPVSENIGRKLLMLCSFIAEEFHIPHPVIVMCHGRNPKSVSILGSQKKDKISQVVINSRGSISKHEQLLKLSAVKLAHLSGFVPSCTAIETSVYARYDVLMPEKAGLLGPCKNMDVVIECLWSNPSAMLEPISSDCTCYVKIKTILGDDDSGAFEKFKEVKLIMALREGLDSGVMQWPEFCSCANLMERVEDFMKAEIAALMKRQETSPPVTNLDFFDIVVCEKRSNLDFTDRLWLVLKDCSSCEELKEALNYVFEELSGLMDLPFVYPKNSSTIAVNIKQMREKAVSWPYLTSQLASQMLLEIGIEKLRGDYVTLFAGLELAPSDSITYFLLPELTSTEAVICLEKLHSTLELANIGLKCLCLPKMLLSEFVRNVLKFYSVVPNIDLQHFFKFQIPSDKARALLDQMRPTVWELSLLSSDKDYKKQTVHHYSTTPTSEHVYAPKDYHPKLMLKNASYVHMTGILIEDSFFMNS